MDKKNGGGKAIVYVAKHPTPEYTGSGQADAATVPRRGTSDRSDISIATISAYRSSLWLAVDGHTQGCCPATERKAVGDHKPHEFDARLVEQRRILANLLDGDWC